MQPTDQTERRQKMKTIDGPHKFKKKKAFLTFLMRGNICPC